MSALTRIKTPFPFYDENASQYSHPSGWRIIRCERDWTLRGAGTQDAIGMNTLVNPKVWWEVYPLHMAPSARRRKMPNFEGNTLRECRAWCDEHDRKGGVA